MFVPNLLPLVVLLVGLVLLLHLVAIHPYVLSAFRRALEYMRWSESYTVLRRHDGNRRALVHFMHFGSGARDLETAVAMSLLSLIPILLFLVASLPSERPFPQSC